MKTTTSNHNLSDLIDFTVGDIVFGIGHTVAPDRSKDDEVMDAVRKYPQQGPEIILRSVMTNQEVCLNTADLDSLDIEVGSIVMARISMIKIDPDLSLYLLDGQQEFIPSRYLFKTYQEAMEYAESRGGVGYPEKVSVPSYSKKIVMMPKQRKAYDERMEMAGYLTVQDSDADLDLDPPDSENQSQN